MRLRTFTSLLFLFSLLNPTNAQDETEQVLVFRNTGEVNLLYANEIDSIVYSYFDKDSIIHEYYVSQVFYTANKNLIVPINEIDSVAFGHRNITEYKNDVHLIIDKDLRYIIRYDSTAIYYRNDSPEDIIPAPGEKLFYDKMDNIFPIGLCAKVAKVENKNNEIKVHISNINLDEVFEKLFFAGRLYPEAASFSQNTKKRSHEIDIPFKIDLKEKGSIELTCHTAICTDFVVQPLKHYYHADVKMGTDIGFILKLFINSGVFSIDENVTTLHFPNIAGVLHPQLSFGIFAELNAELSFNYSIQRHYFQEWEWTRMNGEHSVTTKTNQESSTPEDKAQMDVTCNGNLYFGPKFTFEFNTLLSSIGTRTKIKIGPEVESEVGIGLIQKLSKEYDPKLYSKAELNISTKLGFSGHTFTKNIFTGEQTEYTFFDYSNKWGHQRYSLFPDFIDTKAVEIQLNNDVKISSSTKSDEEIIRNIETGFQLENNDNKEIIEQVFVDTIFAEKEYIQGIHTEFFIPKTTYDPDVYVIRPIFKYAGHTILADKASIMNDNHIQPIILMLSDGINYVVSGHPAIGHTTIDSTFYNIGNYMPISHADTVFNSKTIPTIGIYIETEEEISLIGTWYGIIDNNETVITFGNDYTGHYKQKESKLFEYRINYPQGGDITMIFNENTPMVFNLYSLTNNEMILKSKKQNKYYTFTKTKN